MTISRYESKIIFQNDNERYKNILKQRNIKLIRHFETAKMPSLQDSDYIRLRTIPHIWKLGDRYFKLADRYYNDAKLWWVIAWFNQKPTDGHLNVGDPVYIPVPVEDALYYYNLG